MYPVIEMFVSTNSIKRFFIFCHIILALDFGYVNRPTVLVKKLIQILTLANAISLSAISVYFYYVTLEETDLLLTYLILIMFHYLINSLILILTGYKGSFYKLQKSLMSIDFKLYVNSQSYGIEKKILVLSVGTIINKLILDYVFCMKHNNECVDSALGMLFYILQQLSVDMVMVVSAFMFYCVYCRLQVFNSSVKNNEKEVTEFLMIYKAIADALERAKQYFDVLYLVGLVFKLPDLVTTIFISLLKLKTNYEHDEAHNHLLRNLYAIQVFLLVAAPAVTAGLVTSAVEELRVIIHDRLLLERGEDHVKDLEMFLGYAEGRPLQFTIFKIMDLDWSLPVLLLNVCISYQIIIVQITNLY